MLQIPKKKRNITILRTYCAQISYVQKVWPGGRPPQPTEDVSSKPTELHSHLFERMLTAPYGTRKTIDRVTGLSQSLSG